MQRNNQNNNNNKNNKLLNINKKKLIVPNIVSQI